MLTVLRRRFRFFFGGTTAGCGRGGSATGIMSV